MFIIILLLVTGLVGGIEWYRRNESEGAIVLIMVCAITLFFGLVAIPITHARLRSRINEYYAVKTTIAGSRSDEVSYIERAAITTKIVEINSSIANARYWNSTILDLYIVDEYANLEPLK